MSNFYGHMTAGLVIGTFLGTASYFRFGFGGENAVGLLLVCVLGALVPDIDHERSYIHRFTKGLISLTASAFVAVFVPLRLVQRIGLAILAGVAVHYIFSKYKPAHRGITHSLLFVTAMSILTASMGLLLGNLGFGFAMLAGGISHLLLDREIKVA